MTVFISYFVHLLYNVCGKDLSTRPYAECCRWRDKIDLAFEEFTGQMEQMKLVPCDQDSGDAGPV